MKIRRSPRRRLSATFGVAAVLALGACAASSSTPASAQLGTTAKTATVGLKALKFEPKRITVAPGTKINFVWRETVAHNVVFSGRGPKSKTMNKGTWSTSFKKPGVYKYKCTLHPGMDGQVTVK